MQFPKITIQEIVQHEIHHAKNKLQIDKHFTYYKSIMQQRNLNIFTLNESFYIPDIEIIENLKENVLKNMLIISAFYGDISESESLRIFNNLFAPYIDFTSNKIEINTLTLNEKDYLHFLNSRYYPIGSYIMRFSSVKPSEKTYLVSNYYLVGEFSVELNNQIDLIIILWRGNYDFYVAQLGEGYYAEFRKEIYDGLIYLNFIVQGSNSEQKAEYIDEKNPGINYNADKAISHLINIIQRLGKYNPTMYNEKDALVANYWKNDTSLEERTLRIFDRLNLGIQNFEKENIDRQALNKVTANDLYSIIERTFISEVKKISIQLYPYNTTIPSSNETHYFFNSEITSITKVDNYEYISIISNKTIYPRD